MKLLCAIAITAICFAACKKEDNVPLPEERVYHQGSYTTLDSTDEGRFEYWDDYTKSFFNEIDWTYESQMPGGVDSFRLNKKELRVLKYNTTTIFSYYTQPYVSYKGLLVFPDKYKSVTSSGTGSESTIGGTSNLSGIDTLNTAPGTGRFYYAFFNQQTRQVYTKGHYDIKFVEK